MSTRSAPALLRSGVLGLVLIAATAHAPHAGAQTPSEPAIPGYTGYVNDLAGVMDEPSRAKLESFLDQFHQKTLAQMAVLTVKTTAPLTPSEYKVKVFERWKIGDAERDDGVLMLVSIDEREVRFETGYGLEGTLPDGFQSRIFRRDMAPRFRAGDYAGGITQGVLDCATSIAAEKGVTLEWDGSELRYDDSDESHGGLSGWVVALILLVIVTILRSALSQRSGYRRYGGWGGGWGGWGGGFGGGGFGGGGFGGGGGGGSFGGFGGGSSGGGGGGGNW